MPGSLTLPIMAAMVFAAPVIIDPLFNRFEPLAKTNPELTTQLRSLAHSSGLDIPESRIFLMHASDKVTTYNAYVTGFGATKRIVVWDTTARDLTLPQTLFVFGHEMGHYVLHHIYLGLAFCALLLFAGFWLTRRLAQATLARFGQTLADRALGDWSSLPCSSFLPRFSPFSANHWPTHSADGKSIRPMSTAWQSPHPSPQTPPRSLLKPSNSSAKDPTPIPIPLPCSSFWSYFHPPIADRIRFVISAHSGGISNHADNSRQ